MVRQSTRQGTTNYRPSDEELLDSALEVVAELGFRLATMDELAARVGTTKQTLYAHFGSKQALHTKIHEREIGELRRRLFDAYASIPLGVDIAEAITRAIEPLHSYASERPSGIRILFDAGAPDFYRRWSALLEDITTTTSERTQVYFPTSESEAKPVAAVLASMIVASAVAGNRAAIESPDIDPALATSLTAAFITSGIKGLIESVWSPGETVSGSSVKRRGTGD